MMLKFRKQQNNNPDLINRRGCLKVLGQLFFEGKWDAYKTNGDLVLTKRSPSDKPATVVTGSVKLPLLWLVYSGGVSPIRSSRLPQVLHLTVTFLRFPLSEIIPGLNVLLRNLSPPGRIRECCYPCGLPLSLLLSQKGPFISYLICQIYYPMRSNSNFSGNVL